MSEVIQLISTVGFPCAMCLIMCYIVYKMNDSHKQEMNELVQALNDITNALTRLEMKLNSEDSKNE